MLVLYRKAGEAVQLGRNLNNQPDSPEITIKILTNDGNHVRIGIDAPKEMTVHRDEVCRRILKSQQSEKLIENED